MESPPLPPPPPDEAARLATLRRYAILDTLPDRALDELAALAGQICGTPIALISLVDERRQWFKSAIGLTLPETPRDQAFCAHAIREQALLVVPDATQDPRFAEIPLVTGEAGVRFYAGAPLVAPDHAPLGALCVMDRVPRTLTPQQELALRVLASQVMTQLELRRHTRALRESEERLQIVADNARVGLTIVGPDRCYRYANSAYAGILGLPDSDLVGRRLADVLPGVYEEQIRPRLDQAFAGERVAYDLRKPAADGDNHYAVRYEPRSVGGAVEMVVVVITEITERKRAEIATLRLAAIVEFSDDAIIGKDLQSIITSWNAGAERIFGYAAAEIVGTSVLRLIPEDRHAEEERILERIRRGESVQHFETQRRTKDGRLIDVSVTASPIKDEAGRPVGVSKVLRDISGRKRAEATLSESEAKFRLLAENISDVFWITSPDFQQVHYVSPGYARIWGRSTQSLYDRPLQWVETVLPGERERVMAVFQTLASTAPSVSVEYPITRPDGTVRWVHDRGFQVRDGSGRLVRLTGIATDITERRLAEERRRGTEARFRTLFDCAPDGIVITDAPGRYLEVNASLCRMLGYTREELVGRTGKDVVAPDEIAAVEPERQAIRDSANYNREWRFRRKDGAIFTADVIATVMPDGNFIAMIRETAERHQAAARIAEQAALLDQAREGIMVREFDGRITYWNEGANRMYGFPPGEAVGRNIRELVYADPARFAEVTAATIATGEWHGELQHRTRDGRELTVEARCTLIRDRAGRPKSVLAINADITERKQIEAQFLRAQRMESIGTLAGGIAHDLNNILTPIMMSIELLRTTSPDPRARQILGSIETSAQRGADIVRQVLSFARGVEGERIEVQPKHLLKELERIIRDTFPKDIRLRFIIPPDGWTILGDPTQVHQILLNLCVNARDAMPQGGLLTVELQNSVLDEHYAALSAQAKPGRYVTISVTDTGTGIPREIRDKIFEPFFTTKDLNKGTGLGLSTVTAIVKSHGGIINLYSEVGKGSTFRVYLPAMDRGSASPAVGRAATDLPRGRGETVLVVDDEASVLGITTQTLQAFGYRVLTAVDGADGLRVYVQNQPAIAVVLTDMMMPIMAGPALIQALRRISPRLKILASSGLAAEDGSTDFSGAVGHHFLAKPYTAETLLQAVRAVLDER